MAKLKVLQLHPDYNIRALDVSDLGEQLFKALPKDKYETVTGFLSGNPSLGQPESCADRSVYFNFTSSQLKGLRLRVMWDIYRFLKKEKFDIVICNRYKPVNILLSVSRFFAIPKCIAIVHGFGDYDRSYRKRHLARNIKANWTFVGVSKAVQDYLIELKCG